MGILTSSLRSSNQWLLALHTAARAACSAGHGAVGARLEALEAAQEAQASGAQLEELLRKDLGRLMVSWPQCFGIWVGFVNIDIDSFDLFR